jgi:GT2 family glycosyltransferase
LAALVSVVFDPGRDDALRAASLASLDAQTHTAWEVVDGLASATGEYVAFLDAADTWVPERLARLVGVGAPVAADRMEGIRGNGEREVYSQPRPTEAARLLFRRDVLVGGGGIDPEAGPAWVLDFLLRNPATAIETVPEIGVLRRFPDRRRALALPPGNARHGVLNRHLVDWAELERRPRVPGLTSIVVPAYEDSELTTACVGSLVAAGGEIEVLVWDNGSAPEIGAELHRLEAPAVRVVHAPENYGFALGNNLGFQECAGDVVVFLNNDTTVPPGWLAPLRTALDDPEVLGAQPLLVYPTGEIQSAGVAFPSTGGLPYAFLQGFPVEDAAGLDDLHFHALTGAALALRSADAVALRGFDPLFTNGMEDVDLCRRLESMRPGHFRIVTEAPVVHHESRSPGRYLKHLANRELYLARWSDDEEPRDDIELWGSRGLTVVEHRVVPRKNEPAELAIPQPVLVRAQRLSANERPGRLRWAIKNPAPAGEGGERWGDTHFADSLAAALRGLGQEVVVDRRPEWDRLSGVRDDVALVLRGLHAHEPGPAQVTLAWVISHPDDVTPDELRRYDRVAAAGTVWADRVTREWGIPVEPLLQATDPALFHPHDGLVETGHEVLFVGNSRRELRPVVRDALAAGLPLTVYGDLWAGLVPDEVVAARSIPNAELSAAYAAAGVVLNDHWDDMRAAGFVSNRLFDAVASGARVVSDDVAGAAELFGDSVQVYTDVDDLRRLATLPDPDAVFGDAGARRRSAERVRTEHSFAARAERLVELAQAARRDRGLT